MQYWAPYRADILSRKSRRRNVMIKLLEPLYLWGTVHPPSPSPPPPDMRRGNLASSPLPTHQELPTVGELVNLLLYRIKKADFVTLENILLYQNCMLDLLSSRKIEIYNIFSYY